MTATGNDSTTCIDLVWVLNKRRVYLIPGTWKVLGKFLITWVASPHLFIYFSESTWPCVCISFSLFVLMVIKIIIIPIWGHSQRVLYPSWKCYHFTAIYLICLHSVHMQKRESQEVTSLCHEGTVKLKLWLSRTYLVVQWLGIPLPMQETRVWFLVQEDPTYLRATQLMSLACTTTKTGPCHSLQLEKTHTQHQRPSTAKNKINTNLKGWLSDEIIALNNETPLQIHIIKSDDLTSLKIPHSFLPDIS